MDHLGCDAQRTEPKEAAFKRLALAAEGECVTAGCKHCASFSEGNVYRMFEVRRGSLELTAFVRALLAIELGFFEPADRFFSSTTAKAGEPTS